MLNVTNNKFNFSPRKNFFVRVAQERSDVAQSPIMGTLGIINTTREREIDVGREYQYPPIPEGGCYISRDFASRMEIEEGTTFYARIEMRMLLEMMLEYYKAISHRRIPIKGSSTVIFPCNATVVLSSLLGKYPTDSEQEMVLMEMDSFLPFMSQLLDENWDRRFKEYLGTEARVQDYADLFVLTLPKPRIDYYKYSDYDKIQNGITRYANDFIDQLGFYPATIDMPVLQKMRTYSFAVLFLGLLLLIIVMMFVAVSVLLIYSLLMISVETRTFEIAVLRMVGMPKNGVLFMILIQSFLFVIPSVIIGIALSFLALDLLYTKLLGGTMGYYLEPIPTATAILAALGIGILIPLLSSIAPIMSARNRALNEALDYTHSKTQAVYIKILQTRKKDVSSYVAFGLIAVAFGVTIYYFLPLSLLSMNFGLVLEIFFLILLGLLAGLAILSLNLQRLLEYLIVHLVLFFEKRSMKKLVLKNLTAHKLRNRLTSVIYALTTGFVILCIVSYNLEIRSVQLLV